MPKIIIALDKADDICLRSETQCYRCIRLYALIFDALIAKFRSVGNWRLNIFAVYESYNHPGSENVCMSL